MNMITQKIRTLSIGAFCLLVANTSFASSVGGDLPWDKFLKTISDDLSSNVVLAIGIMCIVGCGLTIAFTDLQSGGKRAVTIGIGLSVAFASASLLTKLLVLAQLYFRTAGLILRRKR